MSADTAKAAAPAPVTWRVGVRYLSAKADFLAFRAQAREGRMGWGEYLRSVLRPGMVYRAFDLSDMGPPVQMAADWFALKCKGSGRWVRSRLGMTTI